jgi:FKBP-type peptidyl-prolyl cis-trans isomerase
MKFGTYLALVGAVTATQIRKGTGMTDIAEPVARSSAEASTKGQSLVQHGDSSDDEKPAPVKELKHETHQPELSYFKSYDHDMFQGAELRADNARMTIDITTKVKGPYCAEDDYVVATWKKWNGTDGTKMEDVKESGDGRPAVFKVGHFQVSKCLDLAAQQMHSGEVATITCPQDLDQGGDV